MLRCARWSEFIQKCFSRTEVISPHIMVKRSRSDSSAPSGLKQSSLLQMFQTDKKGEPVSKKPKSSGSWSKPDDANILVYTDSDWKLQPRGIAAFDFDGTLVTTRSGKKFPTNGDDWVPWHSSVYGKLSKLSDAGYSIAIISNQGGVEAGKATIEQVEQRFQGFIQACSMPIICYAALSKVDAFRKPATGMLLRLLQDHQLQRSYLGEEVSESEYTPFSDVIKGTDNNKPFSFFVGDAAGRAAGWSSGAKADFSSSDRCMAMNARLPFYTPEEVFKGEPRTTKLKELVSPAALFPVASSLLSDPSEPFCKTDTVELVLTVGYPASGKSTFAKKRFPSYTYVSRDVLKTPKKCLDATKAALKAGKSVIVDNTSPTKADRAAYLSLAKDANVPCRVFVMDASIEQAMHMNAFRAKSGRPEAYVPRVAFYTFRKRFEPPKPEEHSAVEKVIHVRFVPQFDSKESREMFYQYT